MTRTVHGFGPPSADFSHRMFLLANDVVPQGTRLVVAVDHGHPDIRLAVAWGAGADPAEPLAPTRVDGTVRQFVVLAPLGTPVVELVPVTAGGESIAGLSARYKVIADVFEALGPTGPGKGSEAPASSPAVGESEAGTRSIPGSRMPIEACVVCGCGVPPDQAVRLDDLELTEADALRILVPSVSARSFVCLACRTGRLGSRERILGGVGRAQGIAFVLARVLLRGYLAALLAKHALGLRGGFALCASAWGGAFLPLELLPILAYDLARGSLGMMGLALGPFVAFGLVMFYPHETLRVATGDIGYLLEVLGLHAGNLQDPVVIRTGALGGVLAAVTVFARGDGEKALTRLGDRLRDFAASQLSRIRKAG